MHASQYEEKRRQEELEALKDLRATFRADPRGQRLFDALTLAIRPTLPAFGRRRTDTDPIFDHVDTEECRALLGDTDYGRRALLRLHAASSVHLSRFVRGDYCSPPTRAAFRDGQASPSLALQFIVENHHLDYDFPPGPDPDRFANLAAAYHDGRSAFWFQLAKHISQPEDQPAHHPTAARS